MGKVRFFRWYRTIPIMLMLAMCLLTAGVSLAPAGIVRSILFPVHHAEAIKSASQRYGVDEYLICAVIKRESNWDANAVSSVGAVGLMQLMPSTSREIERLGLIDGDSYDPDNLTDPVTNIEYGTAYLSYLQGHLNSRNEVVAAYNAGLGSVSQWLLNGSDITSHIEYAETASYLVRVNDAYDRYAQLYPQGIENTRSLL
jgi:soluble lytic murein transglycosylase